MDAFAEFGWLPFLPHLSPDDDAPKWAGYQDSEETFSPVRLQSRPYVHGLEKGGKIHFVSVKYRSTLKPNIVHQNQSP
jgi:hypothetical protein